MKRFFASAALITLALVACQTAPTPVIEKPEYQLLGKLEVAFGGDSPIGVARAKFTPNRLATQALVNEANLEFNQGTYGVSFRASDGNSFLNQAFDIKNKSGAPLQNMVLVALHQSGNEAGTALKDVADFGGVGLPNYAKATKPTHAMSGNGTVNVVTGQEHLMLFSEFDLDKMTAEAGAALGANDYLLPYGYIAKNKTVGSATPYEIPSNNTVFTGQVTLGMRVDGSNEPNPMMGQNSNAERFRFTAMVFSQPTPLGRVAQSLEEIGTGAALTRLQSIYVNPALDGQLYLLNGSASAVVTNPRQGNACRVRTAGTKVAPTTFLGTTAPSTAVGSVYDCFGAGGKRLNGSRANVNSTHGDVTVLADGSIATVGSGLNGTVRMAHFATYQPSGALLTAEDYLINGSVSVQPDYQAITKDAQNRILMAGHVGASTAVGGSVRVQRQLAGSAYGTGDTTFGINGSVSPDPISGTAEFVHDMALQSDGKIIVAGFFVGLPGNPRDDDMMLFRLNTDGTLDNTFNSPTGYVRLTNPALSGVTQDKITSIAIDSSDRIVATGSVGGNGTYDTFVARFTSAGVLDTSFNTTVYRITNFNSIVEDFGLSIALDGSKIVMLGRTLFGPEDGLILMRLNDNGSLDTSFDTDGSLVLSALSTSYVPSKILIQPNSKIIVIGSSSTKPFSQNEPTIFVFRFNANGSLDTTFNATGTTPGQAFFDLNGNSEVAYSAAITGIPTNARLMVVGDSRLTSGGTRTPALLEINLGDITSGGSSSN